MPQSPDAAAVATVLFSKASTDYFGKFVCTLHISKAFNFLITVARGVKPCWIVKQKYINVSQQHVAFIFRVKDRTYCQASPLGRQYYS